MCSAASVAARSRTGAPNPMTTGWAMPTGVSPLGSIEVIPESSGRRTAAMSTLVAPPVNVATTTPTASTDRKFVRIDPLSQLPAPPATVPS